MWTTECPLYASMRNTCVSECARRVCVYIFVSVCARVCVTGLSPGGNVCRPYNWSRKRNTLEYIKFDFMNNETPTALHGYCTHQFSSLSRNSLEDKTEQKHLFDCLHFRDYAVDARNTWHMRTKSLICISDRPNIMYNVVFSNIYIYKTLYMFCGHFCIVIAMRELPSD